MFGCTPSTTRKPIEPFIPADAIDEMVTGEYSVVPVDSPIGQVNGSPVPAERTARLKIPVPLVTNIFETPKPEPVSAPAEDGSEILKFPMMIKPLLVKLKTFRERDLSSVRLVFPNQVTVYKLAEEMLAYPFMPVFCAVPVKTKVAPAAQDVLALVNPLMVEETPDV